MSEKKKIVINCDVDATLPLSYLKVLQGDLKTLTEDSYQKLKRSIIKLGFSFPFFIWEDPNTAIIWIIDGTQRFTTLNRMKDEGYRIPQVPVVFIKATDLDQAKAKCAVAASHYGEFSVSGTQNFFKDLKMPEFDFFKIPTFSLPPILDIDKDAVTTTVESHERTLGKAKPEKKEPEKAVCACPKCGHEFNPFEKKPKTKIRKGASKDI